MADFRQLALDFVLEDDGAKSTSIAQKAAKEIESAPPNSNPVARWVESVQPWMPGSNDDDVMRDGNDNPDWTARAKALEFLSRTLDYLKSDVLKSSQVKLLVSFFGAMFDVDHKAGIMASSTALSRIIVMKAFSASNGNDIVQKVCALKDDFPRQISKTRLAVYELLRSLMSNPSVAKDLQQKDGGDSQFMKDLLQLCQSERDPDCLMVWFDTLRLFLEEYSFSKETLEEVYGAFKAYFPITLPRTAQSGVTPEELKLQLRKCFSSNYRLADLALPFLIGKLDQGDGVTVNVKVDVLRTIRACLEQYSSPQESIVPYTTRIWTSLKYEVRNGEIEDTIWATLEVLKALTTRLSEDDLRDYSLNVTRDCVADLATPMYTTAAGRLLISVLSANPNAFVLMVAPAVTHIKENLRHPKSPTHSQDLLKILRIILETRLLLTGVSMAEQEKSDFAAVDGVFKGLYTDVYEPNMQLALKYNADEDDLKLSTEAVQGAAALLSQQKVASLAAETSTSSEPSHLLLPEATCSQACEALFSLATNAWTDHSRRGGADDLVNEAAKSMQRITVACPKAYPDLVSRGTSVIRQSLSRSDQVSMEAVQSLAPLLAFIGCSAVVEPFRNSVGHFLVFVNALCAELSEAMNSKSSTRNWCSLLAGLHSAIRYFSDACLEKMDGSTDSASADGVSLSTVVSKYPHLAQLGTSTTGAPDDVYGAVPDISSVADARSDALLVALFVVGKLYNRATKLVEVNGGTSLALSNDFTDSPQQSERRYLYLLSELAGFVIHELSEARQATLKVENYALNLFHDEISLPIGTSASASSWKWLLSSQVNTLSFGILEALRPSRISNLYEVGVAQQLLLEGITRPVTPEDIQYRPVKRSILALLVNRYPVETATDLMTSINTGLSDALAAIRGSSNDDEQAAALETALSIFTLTGGLLRRYTGKNTQELFQTLQTVPNDGRLGFRLSRGLEAIVAPQRFLTKDNFAVVKALWLQKLYVQLVKPMLGIALSGDAAVSDPLVRTNYSLAVLLMVKHMNFSIYEEDADKILRIAITIAQNLETGSDGMAALQVIKNILVEASDKAQDHLRSLIKICTGVFNNRQPTSSGRPEWLPKDYAAFTNSQEVQAGCGKLALEIVGGLPRMFESRHLLAYEPQVQRDLSTACGHSVRELRSTARLARGAWAEVK